MLRGNKKGQELTQVLVLLVVLVGAGLVIYFLYTFYSKPTEGLANLPGKLQQQALIVCEGMFAYGNTGIEYCNYRTTEDGYSNCADPRIKAEIARKNITTNPIDCSVTPKQFCGTICAGATADAATKAKIAKGTIKFNNEKFTCPPAGATSPDCI